MTKVRFVMECPGAQKVYVTGDFNKWNGEKQRMKRVRTGEDTFTVSVDLKPGRHEFKYLVDGEWRCCPHAPRVFNEHGTQNSVIEVPA